MAVLPVVNQTGDPDLEWVSTGLMSLVNRLLQDHGIDVVAERPVLALAEAGGEMAAPLQKTEQATHLLESRLGFDDGIYRLEFTVRSLDGGGQRTGGHGARSGRIGGAAAWGRSIYRPTPPGSCR